MQKAGGYVLIASLVDCAIYSLPFEKPDFTRGDFQEKDGDGFVCLFMQCIFS